jgi:hypothetical protein
MSRGLDSSQRFGSNPCPCILCSKSLIPLVSQRQNLTWSRRQTDEGRQTTPRLSALFDSLLWAADVASNCFDVLYSVITAVRDKLCTQGPHSMLRNNPTQDPVAVLVGHHHSILLAAHQVHSSFPVAAHNIHPAVAAMSFAGLAEDHSCGLGSVRGRIARPAIDSGSSLDWAGSRVQHSYNPLGELYEQVVDPREVYIGCPPYS